MSKSKALCAYPEVYFQIFDQVMSGTPYVSPPLEKRAAENIRFDMYGFRRAAEEERHPCARMWRSFKLKVLPVEEEGLTRLEISNTDSLEIEELLRTTLENDGDEALESPVGDLDFLLGDD